LDGKEISNDQRNLSQRKRKRIKIRKIQNILVPRQAKIDVNVNDGKWNYVKENKNTNESWGDEMEMMDESLIRIVSRNIGGLRVEIGNMKEDELKSWIVNKEIDICGIQEMGINWENCRGRSTLTERLKFSGWEFSKVVASHNKHCLIGRSQHGGTATFISNNTSLACKW